jgi:hypothetical protein
VSNAVNAARAGKDTLIKIGWWNPSSSIAAYTTATDLVESGRAASGAEIDVFSVVQISWPGPV